MPQNDSILEEWFSLRLGGKRRGRRGDWRDGDAGFLKVLGVSKQTSSALVSGGIIGIEYSCFSQK